MGRVAPSRCHGLVGLLEREISTEAGTSAAAMPTNGEDVSGQAAGDQHGAVAELPLASRSLDQSVLAGCLPPVKADGS